jgi:hypothetical protein
MNLFATPSLDLFMNVFQKSLFSDLDYLLKTTPFLKYTPPPPFTNIFKEEVLVKTCKLFFLNFETHNLKVLDKLIIIKLFVPLSFSFFCIFVFFYPRGGSILPIGTDSISSRASSNLGQISELLVGLLRLRFGLDDHRFQDLNGIGGLGGLGRFGLEFWRISVHHFVSRIFTRKCGMSAIC